VNRLDELERELRAVGLPAARRQRIRAELADHLACDPDAPLGEPADLARRFADELGTAYARRAGFAGFLALVPLGVLFVVLFTAEAVYTTSTPPAITLAIVAGVQLAFVGGTLALLRAWRLRRAAVIPVGEAHVLLRRAGLGLAGGTVTVATLALLVSGYYPTVQWPLPSLAWATVGVGSVSLLLGGGALVRSARLLPVAPGEAGDLASDLGVHVDPRRLALGIAGAVAACIALAGVVQADPLDGLARALGDGVLCLAGFAVLGRPLGLRR
jgi:hypothetical protein